MKISICYRDQSGMPKVYAVGPKKDREKIEAFARTFLKLQNLRPQDMEIETKEIEDAKSARTQEH